MSDDYAKTLNALVREQFKMLAISIYSERESPLDTGQVSVFCGLPTIKKGR
jgi:hypothetical protein